MSRNILLTIAYDGSVYHGWQRQPGLPTVQGMIEEALEKLFDGPVVLNGTSRTDRGVHAYGQCAAFDAPEGIPTDRIAYALNNLLPDSILIKSAEEMPAGFHPRFDAKGKTYVYKILCGFGSGEEASMYLRNNCCFINEDLDTDAMRKAAEAMEGTHDFAAFQAAGGEEKESTVRSVYSVKIKEKNTKNGILDEEGSAKLVTVEVTGDGFLYNMVRIMAGTLIDVGLGRIDAGEVGDIVSSCRREKAGHTAPPQGLYLKKIYFGEEVTDA